MHSGWLATLAALFAFSHATAQDAVPRKDIDARIDVAMYDVSKAGTELYNRSGNEEGCYRLYEGALRTALPLLEHHRELRLRVADAIKRSATQTAPQRSFTLREAIEDIRKTVRSKAPAPLPIAKSLWERLGGIGVVKPVVHEFVAVAAKDPKVNFTRTDKYKLDEKAIAALEKKLVEFISSGTGGPLPYTGREMKTVHVGMKITEAEFNALAADLVAVLKKFNVGKKESDELVAIVESTKKDIVEK